MTEKPILPTDSAITEPRLAIQGLYADRGIQPCTSGFKCQHLLACSAKSLARGAEFATGNWAYVGADYGQAIISGRRSRILFVAMDRGGFAFGSAESFEETQREFRMGAELRWNPHMGGVSGIMEHLVDSSPRLDYSRQFALTNAVKCVEVTNRAKTNPSRQMIRRCSSHLEAELAALRPDVIITQGAHPSDTVVRVTRASDPTVFGEVGERRRRVQLFHVGGTLILTTPHPARLKGLRWKAGALPNYFADGVAAIREEYGAASAV